MLGITTSDAIALGSMIAALTAVCAGLVQGGRARTRSDKTPSLVRADAAAPESLDDLAAAVRELARAIRAAIVMARQHGLLGDLHRNDE